jgi:hypothetical protein
VACPQSQDLYDRSYLLREEARKSWQHTVTDELVYVSDFGRSQYDSVSNISEVYLKRDAWIEIEFTLLGQRDAKYTAIIDAFESDPLVGGKVELNMGTIGGNSPVLVEVTHSVEPPEKVVFKGCRSTCWLKFSDNRDGISGDIGEANFEPALGIGVPLLDNRKRDTLVGLNDIQLGQSPYELVQGGTHAVKGIPASQRDFIGDFQQLYPQDVPLILKVFVSRNSAGVRLVESCKFSVEGIKMTLRPIQLQIGVCKTACHASVNAPKPRNSDLARSGSVPSD